MLMPCTGPALFRDVLVQVSVAFDRAAYSGITAARLGVTMPPVMERAALQRKAEYVAGRVCATRAAGLLLGTFAGQVGGSGHGPPDWPAGLVGSITHTDRFASAALARQSEVRGVGIDAEPIMGDAAALEVCGSVCLPAERSELAGRFALSVLTTLLFSTKESVAKCLYPVTRRMACFKQLHVEIGGLADGSFRARLATGLDGEFCAGAYIEGRYAIDSALVHTGAVLLHHSCSSAGRSMI